MPTRIFEIAAYLTFGPMKKISSDAATVSSKVSLALVFAALVLTSLIEATVCIVKHENPLALALLAGLAGAVLMFGRKFVWNLADTVYDCGDSLLVQRGPLKEIIPFANIVDASLRISSRPAMVTVSLAIPGRLGSAFAFVPSDTNWLLPFSRSGYPHELRERARIAKSARSIHS